MVMSYHPTAHSLDKLYHYKILIEAHTFSIRCYIDQFRAIMPNITNNTEKQFAKVP